MYELVCHFSFPPLLVRLSHVKIYRLSRIFQSFNIKNLNTTVYSDTRTPAYMYIHSYMYFMCAHTHTHTMCWWCRDLLDTLQRWCTDPLEFAYVFLRWDFLTMYTVYCTNYSKGNECLERSLAEDEALREFIDVRRERRMDVYM